MVNFILLKHPLNWITIFLMLLIAGFAGHLTLQLAGFDPATTDNS
jgi:hypothetical protein